MESASSKSYESLKELYLKQGEYEKAIKYAKRILKRGKEKLGKAHANI